MVDGRWIAVAAVLLLDTGAAQPARAASEAEVERLSHFAMVLGRGIGCRLDTKRAALMLDKWFGRAFPPGSGEQEFYLPRFAAEVEQYRVQQHSGDSPDSCADVAQAFYTLRW